MTSRTDRPLIAHVDAVVAADQAADLDRAIIFVGAPDDPAAQEMVDELLGRNQMR